MYFIAVSVNHRTADVTLREKLTFQDKDMIRVHEALFETKSILENVILSTCNRTEVYAVVDQIHTGRYYIQRFLARQFNFEVDDIKAISEVKLGDDAIEHLFRVTSGLDSIVLGETQILGQMRDAFLTAQAAQTTGTIFNELFKQAVTFSKKAHHETDIADNAISVSYAAVELAKKMFGKLNRKRALVIGAGEMGELSVLNLKGANVSDITVINRTFSRAQALAEKHHVHAAPMSDLAQLLTTADIVISSTSAENYVITKDMLEMRHAVTKKTSQIVLVDIAVPRDIEPFESNDMEVFIYDVDDLKGLVDANIRERRLAAEAIAERIPSEIDKHNEWVRMLGVVPVIRALREQAMGIQQETMASIDRKLPHLSERDRKVVSKHTKSIINQMLKQPIKQAKEISDDRNAAAKLQLFQEIFDIEVDTNYQQEAVEKKKRILKQRLLGFES
ncbi:glutamyl-tRNA reductase [Staphylococcus muscae]|uniref:Glutamyl-tRNA reductase n=1 Tax=Staphylococcus muscae TaxID=1294 RepID=A0A240C2F1_9STAP|nr:glutamyl-tRNA reductase [Staphylococcus muscae]AVQ32959.1 glutamyl-tRNA reductase [Staphylococcus muscae]PNZ05128.1 glutamyl-tRNA reductase [Staphylococcus muscae]GGA89435.1 glutamyl-tRNA reductase [Staphylococcus muscae]SNW02197.1 glutamyl-tRNA reductase [Staphylococcus muscae]